MIRSKTPKPNRCKHCRERMPEDKARHVIHDACIDPWLAVQNAKKARKQEAEWRAAARVEKMLDRAKREKQKTRGELMEGAQRAFNQWIRLRDAGLRCICCDAPFEPQKPGGSADAGHYLSRGAAPHLRFDERNVHAQRKNCNRPGGTIRAKFRAGMIARIGLEAVEALECDQEPRKWSLDDLRAIKAAYAAKVKELKAKQE